MVLGVKEVVRGGEANQNDSKRLFLACSFSNNFVTLAHAPVVVYFEHTNVRILSSIGYLLYICTVTVEFIYLFVYLNFKHT